MSSFRMRKEQGKILIFMDDNACLRRERVVIQFHGIQRMNWTSKPLELISIENVWEIFVRSIGELEAKPQELQQLGATLEAAWDALDVRDISRSINFMRQNCEAVIVAAGAYNCC